MLVWTKSFNDLAKKYNRKKVKLASCERGSRMLRRRLQSSSTCSELGDIFQYSVREATEGPDARKRLCSEVERH